MKKLVLTLALASLATDAFAMGARPGAIAAGTDVIVRADYDAATAVYNCAKPKMINAVQRNVLDGYYNFIGEAYAKHNRAAFDANLAALRKYAPGC